MKKAVLIIVPVLIILAVGGFFFLKKDSSPQVGVEPTPVVEEIPVQSLVETNLYGLSLSPRSDKKAVFLKITSFPEGVNTIEYELTYDAKEGPRGVLGTINYKGEDKIQREILLGTCSKNVCRYDEGVKKVTLTIVFKGAKTEKFQGSVNLGEEKWIEYNNSSFIF